MVPPLVQTLLTKHSLLCTNIHSARYRAHPSDPTMPLQFRQQLRNVFCSVLLQTRTHRLLSVKRNLTYFFPSLPYYIYRNHHIRRYTKLQPLNNLTFFMPPGFAYHESVLQSLPPFSPSGYISCGTKIQQTKVKQW